MLPNFERIALAILKCGRQDADELRPSWVLGCWALYRKREGIVLNLWHASEHYRKVWPYNTAFALAVCYALDH